jgi:hypothetical protein
MLVRRFLLLGCLLTTINLGACSTYESSGYQHPSQRDGTTGCLL